MKFSPFKKNQYKLRLLRSIWAVLEGDTAHVGSRVKPGPDRVWVGTAYSSLFICFVPSDAKRTASGLACPSAVESSMLERKRSSFRHLKPRTLFPRDGRRERRRLAARASERASDGDAGDGEDDHVLAPCRRRRPPPRQHRRPRPREEPPRRLGRRPRVPCHQRGPGKSRLCPTELRSAPFFGYSSLRPTVLISTVMFSICPVD